MQDDEQEVQLRNCLDESVIRHEVAVAVEGLAPIASEQLQVTGQVDYQKENQEQASEGHHELATD